MKQQKISGEPTAVDEQTATVAADAVGEPRKEKKRWVRPVLMLLVPALLLLGGIYYWVFSGGSVANGLCPSAWPPSVEIFALLIGRYFPARPPQMPTGMSVSPPRNISALA